MTEEAQGERIASLEVEMRFLRSSVDDLSTEVKTLVGLFQQFKGARWMLIAISTVGGALMAKLTGLVSLTQFLPK